MSHPILPDTHKKRLVIIGGGFGGLELVRRLKNTGVQIVMFDRHNYHTFQPLLYQVATGGLETASIAFPYRKYFNRFNNLYFRMAEVLEVDQKLQRVYTAIGYLDYDFLVIATGSRTDYFGMQDVERFAAGMKDIPQSLDLRSLILQNFEQALSSGDPEQRDSLMNFVVVGGGPTGVEMCGALGELKKFVLPSDYPELDIRRMQIHLLEAGPKLLAGMSDEASASAARFLEEFGVNIWFNSAVTSYDGDTIFMKNQKTLVSKTVIWSAGVKGSIIAGFSTEQLQGSRYKVDPFNKVEGAEAIFAIGDVAAMETERFGKRGHPMVAPVAIQQGKNLAANLKRQMAGKALKPFVYYDKGMMATIGRNRAVVDLPYLKSQGLFAWFIWMFVHLMSLVGLRNKLIVLLEWFWNYVTYDRALRLIIRPYQRISNNLPGREKVSTESGEKFSPDKN